MKTTALCLGALMAAAIGTGCSGDGSGSDATVPKRTAYPRVELYDTATIAAVFGPAAADINAQATAAQPREGWLDIHYPRYGATIHLSARRMPDSRSLAEAVGNRRERMHLNIGAARATVSEFASAGGMAVEMVSATDAGPTPFQFVAVGPGDVLVSGAAVLHGTTAPHDSIAPVLNALEGEMMRLAQSLRKAE